MAKDKIVLQRLRPSGVSTTTASGVNLHHLGMEVRLDLAILDAVLDVRLDPVLHVRWNLRPAMTSVTRAPLRHSSSAAMAAEFLPPITTTSISKKGCGSL
jgi:hypothetical protein